MNKGKRAGGPGQRGKRIVTADNKPDLPTKPHHPAVYADQSESQSLSPDQIEQQRQQSDRYREVLAMQRDAQLRAQPQMTADDYDRADELASQHKARELEKFLNEHLVKPWLKYFRCLKSGRGRPQQDVLLQQEAARMFSGEQGQKGKSLKEIARELKFPTEEAARKAIESYRLRNRKIRAALPQHRNK